jgi:hypothetical protein
MQIGHSSRLPYDIGTYDDKLYESTGPLGYRVNIDHMHHPKRCFNANGAGPRTTNNGFGNSTHERLGCAVKNEIVPIESLLSNRNVKASKNRRGHVNPINPTKWKLDHYSLCGNETHPEFTRLSHPASNYRDVAINTFYNTIHNAQHNIFYDFAHNTRLEAKDNYIPELPEMWEDNTSRPQNYRR